MQDPDDIEKCDHERSTESPEGRGIRITCPDCGESTFVSYDAMYGVSDADFL